MSTESEDEEAKPPKPVRLSVRLHEDLYQEIKKRVAEAELGEAETIRELILTGYEEYTKDPDNSHPREHVASVGRYSGFDQVQELRKHRGLVEDITNDRNILRRRVRKAEKDFKTIDDRFTEWGF
jgi:hypothetical protein